MRYAKVVLFAVAICVASRFATPQTSQDPFASLRAEESELIKPVVERYIRDQAKQNWADLWDIYDQNSDIEFKRNTRRSDNAAPLDREQFAKAWQELTSNGSMPHLTKLQVTEVHSTSKGFIVRGCGEAKRENFHFKGLLSIEVQLDNGKPLLDPWTFLVSMPHSCKQILDQ
jgi:hypothetical protein